MRSKDKTAPLFWQRYVLFTVSLTIKLSKINKIKRVYPLKKPVLLEFSVHVLYPLLSGVEHDVTLVVGVVFALRSGPKDDLRVSLNAPEEFFCLFSTHTSHSTTDPHLFVYFLPLEANRCFWVLLQLHSLVSFVIAAKDEPLLAPLVKRNRSFLGTYFKPVILEAKKHSKIFALHVAVDVRRQYKGPCCVPKTFQSFSLSNTSL